MKLTVGATQEEYAAVDDRWSLAIGRFMTRFAGIEGVIVRLLHLVSNSQVSDALAHTGLDMKRKLLLALVADKQIDAGEVERLHAFLAKVKELSGTRNLAAHRGYVFDVYDDGDGAMVLRPVLPGGNLKAQPIDIDAFEAISGEAERLLDEGWTLHQDLRMRLKRRSRAPTPG